MPTPRRFAALVLTLAASTTPVLLSSTAGASPATLPVGTQQRSCAWTTEISPDAVNTLYPDEAARYWVLDLPKAPLTSLVIRGRYPHARYMSLVSYADSLRSIDGLADVDIRPNAGSSDPFLAGASRRVPDSKRWWTVDVVPSDTPSHPARNTLYAGSLTGSEAASTYLVALRVYLPDRGRDETGGVPLPSVTLRTPTGDETFPNCAMPESNEDTTSEVADLSAPYPTLTGKVTGKTISWHKFVNIPTSAAVAANSAPGESAGESLPPGGFLDNPDNKYIYSFVSTTVEPAVIITGRIPTTARTYDDEAVMEPAQLRYWSMCTNEIASERFYGCVVDEQVPLGAKRSYKIVVTSAANRPANAVAACGIVWLPAGPAADTMLIERNMLPAASFRYSIQRATLGHEKADLGPYYPHARYASLAQVRALGCHKTDS